MFSKMEGEKYSKATLTFLGYNQYRRFSGKAGWEMNTFAPGRSHTPCVCVCRGCAFCTVSALWLRFRHHAPHLAKGRERDQRPVACTMTEDKMRHSLLWAVIK